MTGNESRRSSMLVTERYYGNNSAYKSLEHVKHLVQQQEPAEESLKLPRVEGSQKFNKTQEYCLDLSTVNSMTYRS